MTPVEIKVGNAKASALESNVNSENMGELLIVQMLQEKVSEVGEANVELRA